VRPLLTRILLSTTILASAGAAAWLLFVSPYARFRTLKVVGNHRATESALRHLANLPVGAPLATLDLGRAAENVAHHPWVASVEVSRSLPETVTLRIEERVPVALLSMDGLFLVDATGEAFARARAGELDLPVLTGLDDAVLATDPPLARRLVRDALAIVDAAAARGGIAQEAVSEVHFDARAGYSLGLRNGGEVLLGFSGADALDRLPLMAEAGLDLARPHRVDLGPRLLAVATPL
jgi:cell division protein FtsQ